MRKPKQPTVVISGKRLEQLLDARFAALGAQLEERLTVAIRRDAEEIEHLRTTEKTLRGLNRMLMQTRNLGPAKLPAHVALREKEERRQ